LRDVLANWSDYVDSVDAEDLVKNIKEFVEKEIEVNKS